MSSVDLRVKGHWQVAVFTGQSIGHKRIITCTGAGIGTRTRTTAPPLAFGSCVGATPWAFPGDGTVRNASAASSCLTLLDPPGRNAKVGMAPCKKGLQTQQFKLGITLAGKAVPVSAVDGQQATLLGAWPEAKADGRHTAVPADCG